MSNILQLKITLNGSKPKIWRTVLMESTMTFNDLHLVIQNIMPWTNTHLYQFAFNRNSIIGNAELLDDSNVADDKEVPLSVIFDKPKVKVIYEYDFGDGWIHDLVLEKIIEKKTGQQYPFCIEGEMNGPPEDCGGIYGFYDTMAALTNKKHPQHADIVEWMGEEYNMEEFDLEFINECLEDYKDIELY